MKKKEQSKQNYITDNFKINLRQNRFHDLRHICASLQLANGIPMKLIQEWLGHSDMGTTIPVPNSNTKPVAVHTDTFYKKY